MAKVGLIIPYFGEWPQWFDCFIETCSRNKGIDWIFFTDCGRPNNSSDNVIINETTFEDYVSYAEDILKVDLNLKHAYKLCDLKPFYGYIHSKLLSNYDYWGFCDIDLVVGQMYHFLEENIFDHYEVFSTHQDRLSGHFSIFRNVEKYRGLCFNIDNWEDKITSEKNYGLDELYLPRELHPILNFISISRNAIFRTLGYKFGSIVTRFINSSCGWYLRNYTRFYFFEGYTTPHTSIPWHNGKLYKEQPQKWCVKKDGRIITNDAFETEVIYLHFMNFKKGTKFLSGDVPIWHDLDRVFDDDYLKMRGRDLYIDEGGLHF